MLRCALLAVAGSALVACGGGADDLVRAQDVLRDRDRFDTAVEAGEALAEVADRLVAHAESCEDDCDSRFEAAAYARVLALRVLGCTAPGRDATRTAMLEHVEALRDGSEHPPAPAVPDCPGST